MCLFVVLYVVMHVLFNCLFVIEAVMSTLSGWTKPLTDGLSCMKQRNREVLIC